MTCDQFQESFELYALGLLEEPERTSLTDHLQEGCGRCQAELRRAYEQNAMVSHSVPPVNPPSRLRRRVVGGFGAVPAPEKAWNWQWAYWALAGATILALTIGLNVQNRAWRAQNQATRAAMAETARMAEAVKIMQAPGTQQIPVGNTTSNEGKGTLFVHQHLGVALVASNLAAAPAGWKYESWIVPKNGPPQPVEGFEADPAGQVVTVVPGPVRAADWKAVAVSIEPANSQPTRPTKVVLAAPLNEPQG